MMKKMMCLLIVLILCFSASPVRASEEEPSLMEQVQIFLDAEDYDAAIPLLQEAADRGDAEAQNKLGECYYSGQGVDQDYDKAIILFQRAADQGLAESQHNLGFSYINGLGVEEDDEKAVEYFKLAADQGYARSQYNLGICCFEGMGMEKDYGKAVEYFQKAADRGFGPACYELGSLYYYGAIVEKDYDKAAEYYRKAADLGEVQAFCDLGDMYYNGAGVEEDFNQAAEFYQQAADLGESNAMVVAGSMFYDGIGTKQDYGKAYDYWQRAAEQGEPSAMFGLGECFCEGNGIEKDPEKAVEWYRKALKAGYEPEEKDMEHLKALLGNEYFEYFPVPEEGKDYIMRTVEVLEGEEPAGTMDLRFYVSFPHIPYYGMKAYTDYMFQAGLTVTSQDDIWEIANPNGAKILADPFAGTIEAEDWARFQFPPLPYTDEVGIKDSPCAWTCYSEVAYDEPPAAVIFDFGKYGIPVYADENDVYLPLELLSALFTDVALNHVLWNGENVIKPVPDVNTFTTIPLEWYESEYMGNLLTGKTRRTKDVIREDYAELCFIMDYFYGHPEVAVLDSAISEKGLDAALDDLPGGDELRERLMDPGMIEYMLALYELFMIGVNDGHTVYCGFNAMADPGFPYPELIQKVVFRMSLIDTQYHTYDYSFVIDGIKEVRNAVWGDEAYRECGSTAIIRIDEFYFDAAGWEAYYAGRGEIPADAVGITWTGLKRASENPGIRNILFDLSANTGGSSDMLMYIMDLMFGENVFRGYNVLTGQHEYAVMHSDKNLDGVFDEKDEEVKYDFHYAVLTTRAAFSCGNLMPFLMQEHGAVLIGEPTSGGSCSVQMSTLTNGGVFLMSSWLWALRDANGDSVEGGCRIDLPIERIETDSPANDNYRVSNGDYTPYFDDVMLDRMINEWFAEQAPAAAA